MSNPTPILNNINAFDATQGTIISFNIIGGTDIVRSNIVYIYDLSTNDLICTHLYISTESIHELPPNTDSSIVYASGKSSADFVNNKNYYLQIQTFTNTAGTAGGSGMSVAKTFWCLFNPALSVNAIPAAVSTTSYNVGATYTTNITDATIPVTNIIQQYKFDLYTATGTLVQTSGNIIGSGEQEGTSTTYNITYNFSGLVVNNSYYVVVTTTSTEGMTVSAQSNTFTVSIDTPTLGEATVVNNACDGYISVTSNLSSEYGGSGSGEIASFVTDSVNNISSLKVNLDPLQDLHGYDKPWVGGAGVNLINSDILINDTYNKYNIPNPLKNGQTYTYSVYGDDTFGYGLFAGHTNVAVPQPNIPVAGWSYIRAGNYVTFTAPDDIEDWEYLFIGGSGNGAGSKEIQVQVEKGTVANPTYHPYSNICPITGWTGCEVDVSGVNLLDPKPYSGLGYNVAAGTDVNLSEASVVVTQNEDGLSFPVSVNWGMFAFRTKPLKSGTYRIYIKSENTYSRITMYVVTTDGKTRDVGYNLSGTGTINTTKTVNEGEYIVVSSGLSVAGTQTMINPQIEIGSTATAYQPYNPNSAVYPVSWQTEAGTVYGGTVDVVSGQLVVNRAMIDLGSLTWLYSDGLFRAQVPNFAEPSSYVDRRMGFISSAYSADTQISISAESMTDGTALRLGGRIYIKDTRFTDPTAFKTAVTGQTLCYELATPQTYQLTPQQIQTLVGVNNVWSEEGDIELSYHIPITNLLVKRQDVGDVSGKWLTLYSQPITQASDMDFTYIDFLNQHGKTYRYALVPLLTQQQGDVDVEIEGGYTVSDDVLSVFDGVFIANSNGSQKLKAATEYGDLETNQDVGVLTTIGGKYPFVVSNSNLNYHSGSISALIVPSDFYTSGDLDRLSIVERREAIEKFLTDKTAKILKDWNGNIWLITFVENVEVSFVDDYGMGLGTLSAKWVEIGDVNDQTDLKQTGLI